MIIILLIDIISSYIMTRLAHRLALAIDMLDRPNVRSSHARVTPRGGGIAIVAVLLSTTVAFTAFGAIPVRLGAALAGGGALVAIIGWLDDRRGLPARLRAAVHAVAAAWALAWLGGLPTLNYGLGVLHLGPFGSLLAFVGIIWMINLYNFMDGIDGLAASEAIMTAGVAGILILTGGQPGLAVIIWTLAAATAGFLIWNWAPARIFMGDVGSGFLGYTFAILAVFTENQGSLPLLVWITLLALFIVDATATLLRRIGLGERWYEATGAMLISVLSRQGSPTRR